MRHVAATLAIAVGMGVCAPAHAGDDVRIGLFIGNNEGGASQQRLLFAAADARKMRDLIVDYGGVDAADAILLQNQPLRRIESELASLQRKVEHSKASGHHTTLVFYYSGHGDDDALNIGTQELTHEALRQAIEATGADVRIAMLDACQSGAVVRSKGGVRGPSYAFDLGAEQTRGTAFLTSSARNEYSQESGELGGGFFTHYLHSGLQGAADQNGDGEVGLGEVYRYVHNETSFATRTTRETQTPTFDFDLTGTGDLWLTRLESASARLAFDGGMEGSYSIWDEVRKRYVAEIDGGAAGQIALQPGTYYVHHRSTGWVDEAEYVLAEGQTATVSELDFITLAYDETASRGDLQKQERKAKRPDVAVRVSLGGRGFADPTYSATYLPEHGVAGIDVRVLPLTRRVFYGAEVLSGGRGALIEFPGVPTQQTFVQSTSASTYFGAATGPRLVRAGGGLKGELVYFQRSLRPHDDMDAAAVKQDALSVAPGLIAWVGMHHGRFAADVNLSRMWLPLRIDDGTPIPAFNELTLSVGYRF